MQRKLDVLLWEALRQVDRILRISAGKTFPDYCADELLRLSVERVFITLGEDLVRLRKALPSDYRRLTEAVYVVDFRNQMVHEYEIISDADVWNLIANSLPKLKAKATEMLNEPQP